MSHRSEWSVGTPQKLTFGEPVERVRVRVSAGTVNIVGTDTPGAGPGPGPSEKAPAAAEFEAATGTSSGSGLTSATVEVSAIKGPPLIVTFEDGTLTVAYEDITWHNLLKWLEGPEQRRSADITLAVPVGADVRVGVVDAAAVVSGVEGSTEIRGVTGDTTLVGLGNYVRADTVSGNVAAQALTGRLRFTSVSGDLTVIDGGAAAVRADSVSGDVVVDLAAPDPTAPDPTAGPYPEADLTLNTVSGDIAVRLPDPADAVVDASTKGGTVSCAFDNLRVDGQWGARRVSGTLGSGRGTLKAATVSGAVALLRRPPADDESKPPTGAASLRKDV
ncbi:hypothetical protein QNO07_24275 [Streptomyces sp. 549]|uniref:DUF4097 family beta strand repeat-containing protein n=1 Tax=Streptomyces sp. 549 TaxID=3049076 RepID=UPI0024C3E4C8|nr:DUF4097 family beta strand repeat-containing protein [Streptomyces sp. 549]MDK1476482.1 hypothetical protein [Streptomyces sp. 549]